MRLLIFVVSDPITHHCNAWIMWIHKEKGFSAGFDAHFNIEHMNITSVELFQMYDDHRKKGSLEPTEKEFWGHYTLLKLDKHPNYKVSCPCCALIFNVLLAIEKPKKICKLS